MTAVSIEVERLAMRMQGLPEQTVRAAVTGLEDEIARLLAERGPVSSRPLQYGVVDAPPLTVPTGLDADALRRLLAEHLLTTLVPMPAGGA